LLLAHTPVVSIIGNCSKVMNWESMSPCPVLTADVLLKTATFTNDSRGFVFLSKDIMRYVRVTFKVQLFWFVLDHICKLALPEALHSITI
jgi:hypothetical protein